MEDSKSYSTKRLTGVSGRVFRTGLRLLLVPVNVVRSAFGQRDRKTTSRDPIVGEIESYAQTRSDISSHLVDMYQIAVDANPDPIVELGVRGCASTFVFERVANVTGADLVSVDMEDCSSVSADPKWVFVQEDDVAFGKRFKEWAESKGMPYPIDVLFVDTSHTYHHTLEEIEAWRPHLASNATMIFHDTNLRLFYRRDDGTIGVGWPGKREVIQALEESFGFEIDETHQARLTTDSMQLDHRPISNGLTVIELKAARD